MDRLQRHAEHGPRCVYHGWKFDVQGQCVDMPNEPPESNFRHKIRHTAYPCRERSGLIWTYTGPLPVPPDLPHLEWNMVPENQVYYSIRIAENNFMQAIEGEYDTTAGCLTAQGFAQKGPVAQKRAILHKKAEEVAPHLTACHYPKLLLGHGKI